MLRRLIPGLLVGAIVLPNPVLLQRRAVAAPQPKKCAPQLAPLRTGTNSGASRLPMWRKEEAGPWRGEGWLGWKAGGETLEPVELIVRDAPAIANDAEVTVEAVPQVDFAVRCVPGVRAGRIHSVITSQVDLKHDGPLSIILANLHYTMRIQSAREDLSDARVVLTRGAKSQVLYSTGGFVDEPHFDVAWAGDLDQDGRLDLVVNLNRKYSWHPYRLLLSSRASAFQLVAEAAVFVTGD